MSAVSSRYPVNKEREINIPHIRRVCKDVIEFFKKNNPFRDFSLSYTLKEHDETIPYPGCTITIRGEKGEINDTEFIGYVKFVINFDVEAKYPIKYSNEYAIIKTVTTSVPSVHTDEKIAGQMFGFFLLRLAMIISILGGATILKLDNDTKRPDRAVRPKKGIYGLLQPNMQDELEDKKNISLFSKEYLDAKAERVRYLEPTDIHIIHQNLTRAINGLISNEDKEHKFGRNFIWRLNTLDILRSFFKDKTIFPNEFQGGKRQKGKNTSKKQNKRRPTHKRRRSSTIRR